jgi:RimJ/RimL family protein N-acetyltransferase
MLRPARDTDVDDIRRWRNQEINRAVSISAHEISAAEHAAWWAAARVDTRRRVLVYERAGVPSGVVSFFDLDLDGEPRTGSWGFFLDAEGLDARGETLPAWLEIMRAALSYAFDELRLDELRAEVLEHNTAVRQMNRRLKFVEGRPVQRQVNGRTVTVIPLVLSRS